MTKFNVGDEVRVINQSHGWDTVSKGDKGKIVSINNDGTYEVSIPTYQFETWTGEEYCFELIEQKTTKNQRIAALENEVAELKLIVHELRERPQLTTVINNAPHEPSTSNTMEDIIEFEGQQYRKVDREAREGDVIIIREPAKDNSYARINVPHKVVLDKLNKPCINNPDDAYVYNDYFCRTHKTVAVYELIKSKPLTPNQQRAAIIEKAKKFVKNIVGEYDTFNTTIGKYKDQCVGPIFQINEKKRAITVLIYGAFGKELIFKGLAKCHPQEVFNEHIGKAISLGRALGLDVSEFEQAVQPTEFAVRQKVFYKSEYDASFSGVRTISGFNSANLPLSEERCGYMDERKIIILNDTNAIYGGVE